MALKVIDLNAQLRQIEFLVPTLVPAGYITLIGAREGVGKTTLMTLLAWQMTRPQGRGQFLGHPVEQGPVIYLNTDAADGESRSVRHWLEQHRNVYPDGDMSRIMVLESTGAGLSLEEFTELLNIAREIKTRCVIIDSFMATFPGIDGNRLEQAMRPMLALRDFAAQTGAAVIVLDHLPKKSVNEKEGERGIMGSTGKSAQARSVHLLTRVPPRDVEGREVLRWEIRKNSFAKAGYALGVEVERLEDEQGRMFGVQMKLCELPDEPEGRDTRSDRAKASVIALLTERAEQTVPHSELLAAAIKGGNVKVRTAQQAVREAIADLSGLVREVRLSGRGAPRAYIYSAASSDQQRTPDDDPLILEEGMPLVPASVETDEVLTW